MIIYTDLCMQNLWKKVMAQHSGFSRAETKNMSVIGSENVIEPHHVCAVLQMISTQSYARD